MGLTLLVVVASAADGQTTKRCAWGHYYDRNVESCAPCSKICDAMTTTGTEHQCQSQCQEYTQKLPEEEEAAQKMLNDVQNLPDGSSSGKAVDPGQMAFPMADLIGIPVAIVFLLLLFLLLYFCFMARRKATGPQRRWQDPLGTAEDGAAAVPLQALPSLQPDWGTASVEGANSGNQPSAQPSVGCGARPGIPGDPHVAIQVSQEGRQGSEELALPAGNGRRMGIAQGANSWRLPSAQPSVWSGARPGTPGDPHVAIQVSQEGRQGSEELALPAGNDGRTGTARN